VVSEVNVTSYNKHTGQLIAAVAIHTFSLAFGPTRVLLHQKIVCHSNTGKVYKLSRWTYVCLDLDF